MSVKINSLEIENVKRIKAVKLEPSANGLTIIGGNNNQGKTSVLVRLHGHWAATSTSLLLRQGMEHTLTPSCM